jgi:hypothetical protein
LQYAIERVFCFASLQIGPIIAEKYRTDRTFLDQQGSGPEKSGQRITRVMEENRIRMVLRRSARVGWILLLASFGLTLRAEAGLQNEDQTSPSNRLVRRFE